MMKTILFPGSFDPFTIGHADIVERALEIFDNIVIAIGINEGKTPFMPINQRVETIKQLYK
ncbi:MAG: adenylyltransferase/cytidyltransferase family protein, partial [Bacteroidaceae bacterium]